jgi:hypothetical protein
MKMMAMIGFIMIAASGFAEVMKATGEVKTLVETSAQWIDHSKGVGALLMLLVGPGDHGHRLVVLHRADPGGDLRAAVRATGLRPAGHGVHRRYRRCAGRCGFAGLGLDPGPTSGLNVDGQHHHIWDTVVPTFIHYNLPLLAFGWLAAMTL